MQKLLIKILFFFLIFCISLRGISQINDSDRQLILKSSSSYNAINKYKVDYHFLGKSAFIKYNPVSLIFGGLMYFYQSTISQQFATSCLYIPSCSNFSIKVINEFGLIKGICLTADRLTRCSKLGLIEIHQHRFDQETGKVHETMDMFKTKHP